MTTELVAIPAKKETKIRGRWRTLFALAFGYFIDQGEGQTMSVLFPTYNPYGV